MQQQNNYHYTFEELKTYLYSYADLFQQDRVQDGIHLYSKNAKNIFKEMQKVNDKIKEKQEKYYKKINEKRAKMAEAIQAYTKKHKDDKNFDKNMLDDPDIKQCKKEMKELEAKLNNAVKAEQDKFMQWEKKEMKGQNVIMRNNNYISAAGKSNAIKKGLIGSNEIANFGNVNIKNGKNETISGNLADIVHSVTNLLHQKAQTEKDEAKKSEIEKVIQMIINGVKDFFGIQKDNKKQLEEQSNQLNAALQTIIKTYLDDNFKQVQTNLDVIKQKNEQGQRNYKSITKDTSDLSSVLSTSEKDDIVSNIKQVLDVKNKEPVIDDKSKLSTSVNQNIQQTNIVKQSNNNTKIDVEKLLNKKETENKNETNASQYQNIKSAIQYKNTAINTAKQSQKKELSQKELQKKAENSIKKEPEDKNSEFIKNNSKNYIIKNNNIYDNDEENIIENDNDDIYNDDDDEINYAPKEFQTDKIKKYMGNNDMYEANQNKNVKINLDMPKYIKSNKKQTTLNAESNKKSQTKAKNIKISINKDKQNDTTIKAPIVNNGIQEAKGAQIGSGGKNS